MVTLPILQKLFPTGKDLPAFADAMARYCPAYGVDAPRREAAFLAQVGHESGGLTRWTENLNYSADALVRVWPNRFTPELAGQYARQPERIANKVYANRMGNGDEASGDGWAHRGRGLVQVTGRSNYTALATDTGRRLETLPAWLETPEGATVSALWFWKRNRLNRFVDAGDFQGLTKAINGGLVGYDDRKARWEAAKKALGVT